MDSLITLYIDYLKRRVQIGSSDAKFIGLTLRWVPTVNRNQLRSTTLTHWGRMTQICVFYITTVQYGWCKSAFLTRACFPCTIHLIMQYKEPVSECSCWLMFIETWPHS